MKRGIKIALRPTLSQRDSLFKSTNAYRFVYNWGLKEYKAGYLAYKSDLEQGIPKE
jgi:transposase